MLEPLFDVVVLELVEQDNGSGIIVPDSIDRTKGDNVVFRVIASGPGVWDSGKFVPNKLKPGDLIITPVYGISKFEYKGKPIILSRERDIVLRINPDEEEGEVIN